nr:hypothetical protein [Tanacetum cinerariifolium]
QISADDQPDGDPAFRQARQVVGGAIGHESDEDHCRDEQRVAPRARMLVNIASEAQPRDEN